MKEKIQLILSILLISTMLSAQEESQLFYQIIEKGKLIKISEKADKLEFEQLNFASEEHIFLLAYDSQTSLMCLLTDKTNILIRINLDGEVIEREKIEGLPKMTFAMSTMDNRGNIYLGGLNNKSIYKLNINKKNKNIEQIDLEKRIGGIYDMTYIESENRLYAINRVGELVRVNPKNGTVEGKEGIKFEKGMYGSIWHDKENSIYGFNNNTGNIYKYDKSKKQVLSLGKAPYIGNYNDGTAVIKKEEKKSKDSKPNKKLQEQDLLTRYLSISPNPNKGVFSVILKSKLQEDSRLEIFNIEGKSISEKAIEKNAESVDFNLQHLTAGVYIISLKTKNETLESMQLIIQ